MAWPRNWATAELISSARLNQWTAALRALDAEPQRHSAVVSRGLVSVANSTWTTMSFTAQHVNTGGAFSAGQPTRITFAAGGRVFVHAEAYFAANSTGRRELRVLRNGNPIDPSFGSLAAAHVLRLNYVTHLVVSSGDYLEMQVWQNSGAALDVTFALFAGVRMWG